MKLAVWNVCNTSDPNSIHDQIKSYFDEGYDVVAAQEVPYHQNVPVSKKVAEVCGLDHVFIHTRSLGLQRKSKLTGYGTAVISTASLDTSSHTTLRDDIFAYMTPGRGNQRAAIAFSHPAAPEARFVVAHLSYKLVGGIGRTGLLQERERLQQFLEHESSKGSLIFAGDMNCRPHSALDTQLAAAGLYPTEPTNTNRRAAPTYRSRYPGLRLVTASLDRVYTEPALQPTVRLGAYGQSDHRPLHIEI